jgi:hypothetical protein
MKLSERLWLTGVGVLLILLPLEATTPVGIGLIVLAWFPLLE